MRLAIIEDGAVKLVIEVDKAWLNTYPNYGVLTDEASIGWKYDGVKFTPPPEIKMVDNTPLPEETVVAYRARVNPVLPEGLPEPLDGELVQDYRKRVRELKSK